MLSSGTQTAGPLLLLTLFEQHALKCTASRSLDEAEEPEIHVCGDATKSCPAA